MWRHAWCCADDACVYTDGIEPLVKMTKNDNADAREFGALALANLTTSCASNCQEVARHHGIDPLVSLLSDQRELAVAYAAITLTNMAPDEHLRMLIHNAGVVQALVDPLFSTNTMVQSKVSVAIGAFVCDADARAGVSRTFDDASSCQSPPLETKLDLQSFILQQNIIELNFGAQFMAKIVHS